MLNSVGATSDSLDPNPGLATDTVSLVPIPAADLELTKTAPPDPVAPGGVARYTFRVANRGPSDAPDVVVRDTLPAGLTFLADTRGACSAAGQVLTCQLGAVANGATIDDLGVDARVDPPLAGRTVRNAASVASEPSDPLLAPAETVPASNEDAADLVVGPAVGVGPSPSPAPPVAPVAPVAPATKLDLALRVVAPRGPVRVGDRTRWRVKVVNNGPATATGVRVAARADGGTILAGARVAKAGCDDSSPLACSLETLAPGASRTIALAVRPTRRGTLTLTGTVAGNEPETRSDNNRDRGSVGVKDADTKLALSDTPRVRRVHGSRGLRIVVAVRNRGPHTARDLTVCQQLPRALRPLRLGAARLRNDEPCWTVRSLGARRARRFVLTVRAADVTRSVALTATVRAGNAPSRRASALVRIVSPRRAPGFTG